MVLVFVEPLTEVELEVVGPDGQALAGTLVRPQAHLVERGKARYWSWAAPLSCLQPLEYSSGAVSRATEGSAPHLLWAETLRNPSHFVRYQGLIPLTFCEVNMVQTPPYL